MGEGKGGHKEPANVTTGVIEELREERGRTTIGRRSGDKYTEWDSRQGERQDGLQSSEVGP